jgi:hypothetical protein
MTDHIHGFIVTLDHDLRIDDAEPIREALQLIRGVVDVRPIIAGPVEESIARGRVLHKLREELIALMKELES